MTSHHAMVRAAAVLLVALTLIGIGLLSLLMATVQHRHERSALIMQDPALPRSLAAALAGIIAEILALKDLKLEENLALSFAR